jgi:predicted ATPase
LSSFVGREADVYRLADAQARAPLLTVVGPGGVGKTRLALRLAAGLRESYADGVWFVDVAPLEEPSLLAQSVAEVLGIRERVGQPWLKTLANTLRTRQLLLILDNCDHVAASCAELSEMLLRTCPQLRLVATSRQPLRAANEHVWRVQPLTASEAVSLFVGRAAMSAPELRPSESTLRIITDICRRLDGLPLAIELVAARTESFDLAEIAARMERGLRLRVTGQRTAPARQQTLRATLDWSYSMLTHSEATLLRRLAVFAGGWTLESAEAVCADAVVPVTSIADVLERLVTKSLVMLDTSPAAARYRLLETVREYALERLERSVEATRIRRRHAAHVLELVELVPPDSMSATHGAMLERDIQEVRAALAWAVQRPEVELGLRLATGA